ncbi:MAG: divergent polysaccharide deacetylase family protein [Desulfuromonadales bacterium]
MTKPSKRRRPKKRRPDFFLKNRVLLLLLVGVGLLLAVMVYFARMEEPQRSKGPVAVTVPTVDFSGKVHSEVEAFLATLISDTAGIRRDLELEPARYTLESAFPSSVQIAHFKERLQQIPGNYSVQVRAANSLVVTRSRQAIIVIYMIPPAADIPDGPLLAIIMDDLGRSTSTARMLASLAQPVTFSILPDEPQAVDVAEIAYAAGREVMLHVPMEPQGYPAVNPGRDALFVNNSAAQIRHNFDLLLARIPHVIGTNNHMGSRFTEDARALAPVMESLHDKGLFFIDSRTTGNSKVSEVAQKFGVPTMSRDVFLDNVAEVDAITREIRKLENKARQHGMAIGICHPYRETLEALKNELPGLAGRGVTLVPVSVLLHKQLLLQGS